jgi:hypothetical protein
VQSLIISLIASQAIAAAAIGSGLGNRSEALATAGLKSSDRRADRNIQPTALLPLDRVVTAVDGAESSHGTDLNMWRPDPSGPQGPMQVSEAAALDVGGGDRFNLTQNRVIGRAYLAQLYRRYRNWPDAIAAYNWGVGRVDVWVRAGRPPDQFLPSVAVYLRRVLRDSGLCEGSGALWIGQAPSGRPVPAGQPLSATLARNDGRQIGKESDVLPPDALVSNACSVPDRWVGTSPAGTGSRHFTEKLDQALQRAMERARQSP